MSEGLPNVQHTADVIFSKLMQVDHAIIFFDEIDELVREREIEPDQFGRFLTTSMLPRLAELWKARKVMYFVATNHIEYFDRAVIRSERFDAIIFISSPSFHKKKLRILEILKKKYFVDAQFADDLNESKINEAMPRNIKGTNEYGELTDADGARVLPQDNALSKFALVRWDELDEVASNLRNRLHDATVITADVLKESLLDISDGKSRSLGEYCRFVSDPLNYERFDSSRSALWFVTEIEKIGKDGKLPPPVENAGEHNVVKAPIGSVDKIQVSGYTPELIEFDEDKPLLGAVRLKKNHVDPS